MTSAVRLTALTAEPLSVRTVDPFVIASGAVHATRSVLVRATLDGSFHGLGEGACLPPVTVEDQPDALAAVLRAAPVLVGQTWSGPSQLAAALTAVLPDTPVARAGVEMAVLDAWARRDGLPLWRWLGGTDPVPELWTDMTLPILAPERMEALARQWWALGFRAFKVKVGKSVDADIAVLEALVRAFPDAMYLPDANAGLTVDQAVRYVEAAKRLGARLECFEQPCRTVEELIEVDRVCPAPVLADESVKTMADFHGLRGRVSGVNLKIAKSGGLLAALQIGRAAQQLRMVIMVGGMVETRLGMTAAAHLVAALGGVNLCDLDTAWLLAEDPFVGGYVAEGPRYTLPPGPGLGVAVKG